MTALSGHLDAGFARAFAAEWVAAWNSHDLERILSHYSEDFEMRSPNIIIVAGEAGGVLKGKAAVAAYWRKALERPGLVFTLIGIHAGIMSLALHYHGRGREVIETLEFNAAGKICRASALWKA